MNARKIILVGVVAVVVVVAVVAGYFYYFQNNNNDGDGVFCTMDAKLCPDGSYVGRSGPKCEFAECPKSPTSATLQAALGQTVRALDVTLTPLDALEDSRCPVDVQCIWAGTVKVRVKIQSGLGDSTMIFEPNKPITTEAEQIILKEILPSPKAGIKIKDSEYIFVFEISKR